MPRPPQSRDRFRSASQTRSRARQRLRREVARSVDAPVSLLPVFDRLFKDMPSLGSEPRRLLNMLERAGIGPRSRIIDLACGKGTIAVQLAARLGCRVVAVDACAAFLDEGRQEARKLGVERLVTFQEADVREFALAASRRRTKFNAALMMGLLGIEDAAPMLRRLVKPRGVYAIDDVFRDERRTNDDPDFQSVPTRAACIAVFENLGDMIESVDVMTPARTRALNASLYRTLAANARAVRRAHPHLADALTEFLANQRHANRVLNGRLRPATWLVRKA